MGGMTKLWKFEPIWMKIVASNRKKVHKKKVLRKTRLKIQNTSQHAKQNYMDFQSITKYCFYVHIEYKTYDTQKAYKKQFCAHIFNDRVYWRHIIIQHKKNMHV